MIQSRREQIIISTLSQQLSNQTIIANQTLNDPFEIYHYPTCHLNNSLAQKVRLKVKQNIVKEINLAKMDEISESLERQMYYLKEEIKLEEMENESLDILIGQLEAQVRLAELKTEKENQKKGYSVNTGCQGEQIKMIEKGTMYENNESQNKSKNNKKLLFQTSVFSINVFASQLKAAAQIPQKQNYKKNKSLKEKKTTTKALPIHTRNTGNTGNGEFGVHQIYLQLCKQMKYLKHLKLSNKVQNVKTQKRKVKFLMELFWKHTNSDSISQSFDIELPFIQL